MKGLKVVLTKRQKLFSNISLGIVIFYFAINLFMFLCFKIDIPHFLFVLVDKVLFPIDLFTWHVFGIFAVISFFVKLGYIGKNKQEIIKELIHISFTVLTFLLIFFIFENSF